MDPPQSPKPKGKATPRGGNSDVSIDVKGVQLHVFVTGRSLNLIYFPENVSSFVKLCQAYERLEIEEHESRKKQEKDAREARSKEPSWVVINSWEIHTCVMLVS